MGIYPNMTHLDAIRTQIEELEAEVRRDPRIAAIGHLKAALALLEGASVPQLDLGPSAENTVTDLRTAALEKLRGISAARSESKAKRFHDIVGRYIDDHGPTHRVILVQRLTEAGLMEGIKNHFVSFATTMNTLREHFVSDGKGTYTRREGAPSEVVPIWAKKNDGPRLVERSPQGEAGDDDPGHLSHLTPNDERAVQPAAEAGGI